MTWIAKMTTRPANRREEETMHLIDGETTEEVTLCGADASIHDRITVQYCLRQLIDGIPVGNVCEPCKVHAVRWAANRIQELEADAGELRVVADELQRTAAGCRADGDAARYRNGAEERRLEADKVEDVARELRSLVGRLQGETGLQVQGR